MTLEAQDRKELADAMWNVFPSPSDLGRLLTNHFNVNLAAIAANKPRELELYDCVIRRFDGEGLLLKLVDFAAKENAQNELITGIRDKLIQKAELADVQLSDHEIAKRLSGRRLKLSEWKKSFQHTYSLLCGGEFIGRNADLIWLDRWAGLASPDSDTPANSPVVCLHALGGGGKTSLAWEWAIRNEGDGRGFEKVGYLGIFWCSFYNRGYEFEEFLRQSVKFLELEVSDGPTADYSRHEMERLFLDEVERSRYIFVLDGVERKLRAFAGEETKGTDDHAQDDRIERKELERYEMQMLNPEDGRFLRNLTERLYRAKPDQRSLVLLTSRVPPEELTRVGVSGFCCRSLEGFSHDDALLLWQKEGCTAGNAELLQMFTRWGHHPLVIKILALAVKQSPANGDFDKWLSFPENESFDPTNQPVGLSKTSLRQRALDVILHYLDDAGWQVLECISTHPDANPFRFLASVLVTRLKVFPSQRDLWQKLRDLRDCGLVGQLGEGDLSAFDSHPVIRGYVWKRHQNLADEPNRRRRILEAFGEVLKEYNLQDETDIPEEALSIFLMIGWCRLLLDEKKYDEAWKLYRDKARPRLIASQATELDESLLQRWFEASDGHADLTVLPRLTHHGERAEALSYLASHMMVRESRPDCADRLMRFAATEYLLNGDQGKSIGVRQGRMWRVFYEGRLFEAEVELRRLVVAAATAGLPEVAARAAFWTSLVLAMRGQHDEFDRVVEAVRPIVLKYDRRWAIQGFAEGNYYLGRFEDALRELTALEPRPVNEPDPVPGQKAWEHLTAGMAHLHLGHHKESAECLN